ncbi:unnamed protein product [Acanthoscelides obtectus]|nr:unnamed protein product [Acanthoscelides obtectus]CAK1620855.1 Probable 28S rRNA (cytosine-C(5))-methyltransferase [Acanthoscelides obtectus]
MFKAHLSDVIEAPVKEETVSTKPKYVRVNTLKKTVGEAIDAFRDEEWILIKHSDKNDYNGFVEKVAALKDGEFMVDMHVPSLLIFPSKTHFYNHQAYKNATIVLQDKASCLPVHLLAPCPGSTVLDMCAAPGMKTTQLAAALENQGVIYAVERDAKRAGILKGIVGGSGATCVKVINKDVLQCNGKEFPGVEYILVDPSCSGSGMSERATSFESKDLSRLQKLAGFQIIILRSALTRYPDAKRVVYSTCSLHPEENEEVVRQVLETNSHFKLVDAKKLLNADWKSFGSPDYGELGEFCLYARPDEDLTNGFFLAVFERLGEGEQNTFFNNKIFGFKNELNAKDRRKERKLEAQQNAEQPEMKKGKKNRRKMNAVGDDSNNAEEMVNGQTAAVKKVQNNVGATVVNDDADIHKEHKNKKKKKRVKDDVVESQENAINDTVTENVSEISDKSSGSRKKKKHSSEASESTDDLSKSDQTLVMNDNAESPKRKKKKKMRENVNESQYIASESNVEAVDKKDKKVKKRENEILKNQDIFVEDEPRKKKKKHCSKGGESKDFSKSDANNEISIEEDKPKKKKRKHISESEELIDNLANMTVNTNGIEECESRKKKRKHRSKDSELAEVSNNGDTPETIDNSVEQHKSKKKKRKNDSEVNELSEDFRNIDVSYPNSKKKKKKNKDLECM